MTAGNFSTKFLDWCPFRITVEPFTGFDDYGKVQYGAPVTDIPCQIEDRVRLVTDLAGEERPSTTKLIVIGGPFDPRDRVTMPVGYKGHNQPPIISVSNVNDKDGFSHSEIYL